MPLWGSEDKYANAPKFVTDAAAGETGQDEYGTNVFGVDAAEAAATNGATSGWVRRVAGTGGRSGRVQYESLVALSGATAFATGDATDFANTAAEPSANGAADDTQFPDS